MKKPFLEIDKDHFSLSAYSTHPIEGYEKTTNPETGEELPYCCPFHKSIYEHTVEWFKTFPDCCEMHKAMKNQWWYNKSNYDGIEHKVINQLSYTEHHLEKKINDENWYKDITDYIEYNAFSFGHPAIGLHLYLGNLKLVLQTKASKNENAEKCVQLVKFIEGYYKDPQETSNSADLNILYDTYQKWLNIFPFELNSYFSKLREHFQKSYPFLSEEPQENRYTGLSKAKMHTKSSLFEALVQLTNALLSQVNGVVLMDKGIVSDIGAIQIELIRQERIQQLKKGYDNQSADENQRFRKMVKRWLKDEQNFWKKISPVLTKSSSVPVETKADVMKEKLSNHSFFDLAKIKELKPDKQQQLIEVISTNKVPYQIAMFDFLGFILHLEKNYSQSKYRVNKIVAEILTTNERAVKGNLSTLLKNSREDKSRYTAYQHKENVQKDYQQLK